MTPIRSTARAKPVRLAQRVLPASRGYLARKVRRGRRVTRVCKAILVRRERQAGPGRRAQGFQAPSPGR